MPQRTMRSLKLIGENSTPTNASPDLGAAGSGTSRSSIPSTASPYFTTWAAFIANSSRSASNERMPQYSVITRYVSWARTAAALLFRHQQGLGYRNISPPAGFHGLARS